MQISEEQQRKSAERQRESTQRKKKTNGKQRGKTSLAGRQRGSARTGDKWVSKDGKGDGLTN
jgi:hypothetical protein